jgi:hypothetical protein
MIDRRLLESRRKTRGKWGKSKFKIGNGFGEE